MMVFTEGNTNRECSFFGVGWWVCLLVMDGREQKVGYAEINCAYRSYRSYRSYRVYRSYGGYTIEGIALQGCGGGSYYMRRRFYFRCTPQKRAIISVF